MHETTRSFLSLPIPDRQAKPWQLETLLKDLIVRKFSFFPCLATIPRTLPHKSPSHRLQLQPFQMLKLIWFPNSKFHALGTPSHVNTREIFFTIKLYAPAKLSGNLLRMQNRTCNFRSLQDSLGIAEDRAWSKIKHHKYSLLFCVKSCNKRDKTSLCWEGLCNQNAWAINFQAEESRRRHGAPTQKPLLRCSGHYWRNVSHSTMM